jgi:hypothetical protein
MRLASAVAAVALVAAVAASPDAGAAATPVAESAALADACRHYDNRARFKPREGAVEFTVVLADGCRIALATVADPAADARLRDAALRFLDRLAEARAEIARINSGRVADGLRVASEGRGPLDLTRALRLVSPTGEFLILRAEGVFGALRGWVAAGADFTLVDALGPSRARF